MNFICKDDAAEADSIYSGRNYSLNMIKHISRRNVNFHKAISEIEDRFLDQADKDFLTMIMDSMLQGKTVTVKKVQQSSFPKVEAREDAKVLLSTQDKENVLSIFEMFGGQHQRGHIEKVYLANGKDMERTLDLFLSGNAPPEATDELHVIIEPKDHKQAVDTTFSELQQQKKKKDLRQYVLKEYSGILGD